MKILGFDLASNAGCAFGEVSGIPIAWTEVIGEAGGTQPARFSQMFHLTSALIKKYDPDIIAIEKPIAAGVVGNEARIQLAFGYRAAVFAVAHMRFKRVVEYDVGTIRKYFIGKGNLKRVEAKKQTVERCGRLGWTVKNDDEADALAVWAYARNELAKIQTQQPLGLFDHADNESIKR